MSKRFKSLDGWRGLSIIFVLLGHLFPLGPKNWQMNGAIAASGMAIFFILSGFLIVNILYQENNVINFLIKRFARIIPLAWLVLLITLTITMSVQEIYVPHFLFYANWEPISLVDSTSHFWSLCVEMQFYFGIAILFSILKNRTFYVLPIICFFMTVYRYVNGVEMAINTYYRIDEILAGCTLAIIYHQSDKAKLYIGKLSFLYLLPLLVFSAHPAGGSLNYARPYIALLMIGSTLGNEKFGEKWLKNRLLIYIASISYAVYILHGGLRYTWLGSGDMAEKYVKRILLLIIIFIISHFSTFYYEKYFINLGRKLCFFRIGKRSIEINKA